MEDLNEKIIKEKGNTKCIFYADDVCRNGDKTRDCVNCARVEYHSLYSLNWDNQERLQKIIKHKEQECEELKKQRQADKGLITSTGKMNYQLLQEYDKLKEENDECIKDNEYLKTIIKDFTQEVVKLKQTVTEIKEIAEFYNNSNMDNICYQDDIYEILQKISEVEDGN